MFRALFILISLFISTIMSAQNNYSCCQPSANQAFVMLTSDPDFVDVHMNPEPTDFNDDIGTMVSFKTPDGKRSYAYQILTPYQTGHWLLVFHEWWGLNDHVKKEAVKYFESLKNVNVLVLDLYDGKTATTREDAAKLMQSVTDDRARAIIDGAIKYVGKESDIATVGWCFGGGWSLQAALMAKKQAIACVMYYGMPEKDVEKLKTINCDVLGIFAGQDQWINADVVAQFKKDMEQTQVNLFEYTYDAPHAFANPSNPGYNGEAADDAYKKSIKFLANRFSLRGK